MDKKKPNVKPYLLTRSLLPENQETPIHFLRQWIIHRDYFYRRNHFPYPEIENKNFNLSIEGEVNKAMTFSFKDIITMPSKTIVLPLECSGNKRAYFKPKTYGEQWKDGALSQAVWRGVPLKDLLDKVGIKKNAVEVLFEAFDRGKKPGVSEPVSFARSLPVPKALHPDTIVAYELNEEPIPEEHGCPLRLIVPQWYAMASVKWLKKISLIDYEFKGPFQSEDYVYYPLKESNEGKRPVTTINVNSIIQQPMDRQIIDKGVYNIDGIAWTGEGIINKVEISVDGGISWNEARLYNQKSEPYSWSLWNFKWEANEPGEYTIMSRAHDTRGRVQPIKAEWNRKGYGYNAIYTVKVKIE
jgi:sulfite oxidase